VTQDSGPKTQDTGLRAQDFSLMATPESSDIAGSNERRFRMCQKCGLLTPTQSPACVECGYRSFEAIQAEKESRFLKEFLAHPTPFTYIIFGINTLVFLLMIFCGGTANIETLRAFGAKENSLILKGEHWRFITPIFVHIGLIHMAFNSYALISLGPIVEKLYGSARFVVIYMFAGVVGVIGSFYWSTMMGRPGLAAGASGAIFGLFGALGIFGLKYRKDLPETFRKAFGGRILMTIVINLYIGFALPGIDNAAHVSGLLSGALAALVIPYQPVRARRRRSIWTIIQIFFLGLIIYSFVQIRLHYNGPDFSLQNVSAARALGFSMDQDEEEFVAAWKLGELAFSDSLDALKRANKSGEKFDEQKVVGIIDSGLIGLGRGPRLDKEADQYRNQLKQLLLGNKDLIDKYKEKKLSDRDLQAQEEKYNSLERNFCDWLKTDGQLFRISCGSNQKE
jgi:membrane associated rhomboid family serine protease